MLRRTFFRAPVTTTTSSSVVAFVASSSVSIVRFNASTSSSNSNESEAEREARARQELMDKMMSGGPMARMFARGQQSGAGSSSSSTPGSGFSGGGSSNAPAAWANSQTHRTGRFLASLLVFITGIFLVRRLGFTGDYSHLTVPYFAASPADQTKWLLFIFNVDDARRRQLQQQWEAQRNQLPPTMSFFDFVDQSEPYWRSSPNMSGDQVINVISKSMVEQGAPKTIMNVRTSLGGSSFTGALGFAGSLTSQEERAKRIDALMNTLPMISGGISGVTSGVFSQAMQPQLPSSLGASSTSTTNPDTNSNQQQLPPPSHASPQQQFQNQQQYATWQQQQQQQQQQQYLQWQQQYAAWQQQQQQLMAQQQQNQENSSSQETQQHGTTVVTVTSGSETLTPSPVASTTSMETETNANNNNDSLNNSSSITSGESGEKK